MFKSFLLELNISAVQTNYIFSVNSNDLNTIRLDLVIKDNAELVDLTGKIVRLAIRKPDHTVVFQSGGVTDGPGGKCEFILSKQAALVPGRHEGEVMIYEGNSTVAVTTKFYYEVKRAVLSNSDVESSSDFPAISQAIAAGEILKEIDIHSVIEAGAIAGGVQEEMNLAKQKEDGTLFGTVQERLNDTDEQLANAAKKVDLGDLSRFGGMSWATSDTVSALMDLLSWQKQNAINVKTPPYNVKGDGTNDTTKLNSVFTSNGSEGVTVLLPDGVYLIDNFTGLKPNTKIVGSQKTIIKPFSTGKINLQFLNISNITFANITFDGFNNVRGTTLTNSTFENCKFLNAKDMGLLLETNSDNIKLLRCTFNNIGTEITNVNAGGFGISVYQSTNIRIEKNDISNTKGTAAIMIQNNCSGVILDNDIHDVVYRGIQFYNGEQNWEVKLNRISRCGLNNTTGSGVGCNGIFTNPLTIANIICEENTIIDVVENGIEGYYKTINKNTIINTGLNQGTNPTPSTEGIYAQADTIDSNTIINAKTRAIAKVSSSIANMQITNNVTKGGEYGIYLNADGASGNMANVSILNNTSTGTSKEAVAVYIANANSINSVKIDNRSTFNNLSKFGSINRKGVEYVGQNGKSLVNNGAFSSWNAAVLNGWTAANTTVSKVVEGNRNIPSLTGDANIGRIYQDIETPYEKNIYSITVKFKSNVQFRVELIPYKADGTLDSVNTTSLRSMAFDANNYITEKYTFTNETYQKFRLQAGISGINTDVATIAYIEVMTYNKE